MKTNKLAIISLYLSVIGLFLWDLLFTIIPILAFLLGIMAIIQIHKYKMDGKTKAVWGIGLGLLGILFGLFLGARPQFSSKPLSSEILNKTLVELPSPPSIHLSSLSSSELYQKGCGSLPNISSIKQGVSPAATIEKDSLISLSEFPGIFGTFTNTRGISVVVWKGNIPLTPILSDTSARESFYESAGDHGGQLESCPIGSTSGRYFDKSWKSFPNGIYTVGVYTRDVIYNPSFQGYTSSILLTSGILRVTNNK